MTGDAVLSDDMVVESVGANPISIDAGSTNTVMGNLSEIGKKNRELIASQNESLVASITPRSKNNSDIAQSISNMEEGAPQVVTFPLQGGEGGSAGGGGGTAAPDESANRLPKIGFDNSNIHTMYATSTYGANA